MVNAIVLAGDRKDSPIKDIGNKALIKIKDKFMVEYVIDSLKSSKCVDRIVVTGPESLKNIAGSRVESVLPCGDSIIDNIIKGIDYLNDNKNIIICTSDIPMVSGEAIDDFIRQCTDRKVDIGYPIIEKSLNDKKYPDAKRTYVRLKDGTYTGGNILYINPEAMRKCCSMAQYLVENRKSPMKMGKLFGIIIFIKLVLGILRIQTIEKKVKRVLGINARAIMTPYPEIGNDVDKMEDVDFVNKYMNASAYIVQEHY